jgi:hypothetical protein
LTNSMLRESKGFPVTPAKKSNQES